MGLRTPLHEIHVERGATIVDFGGWDMPLHYGSQIAEHHAVRRDAGMFDVSHMCVIDVSGARAREFLQWMLANDVGKLEERGKALYSCMLLPSGGILDDLIVFFLGDGCYRLVVNAGTRDRDFAWLLEHAADFDLRLLKRTDLAMIAVQGPQARLKAAALLPPVQRERFLALRPFCGTQIDSWFVARTGYTGEDGVELMLQAEEAAATWVALAAAGVAAAGLGARDTLRLEAGLNLYGNDMDEAHHPLNCGLAWTVAFEPMERHFIGREALERVTGGQHLVGVVLDERGMLRSHQTVLTADGPGEITSGTFSPTMNRAIALARVPRGAGPRVQVEIRGKRLPARIVKPPFVRHGNILVPAPTTGE